jgi:hypothetical protein
VAALSALMKRKLAEAGDDRGGQSGGKRNDKNDTP